MDKKKILVTGGMGFIGSHTAVVLIESGYDVVIYDNLSNSKASVLNRIERITGTKPEFVFGDVLDAGALARLFFYNDFYAVIHFAGLKAVGESVEQPWLYYKTNVAGSLNLYRVMIEAGVKKLIYSSSATVYGPTNPLPYKESMPLSAINPYGCTKLMNEQILRDMRAADPAWAVALLRYFNPVGAHKSGLIGEDPNGIPTNLMPYVAKVAAGELDCVTIFGDDYDTPDGTGLRDYIHVMDLARGHVMALKYIDNEFADGGIRAINLGTGKATSVREIIAAYGKACGHDLPSEIGPRRAGDLPATYADVSLAKELLGFEAEFGLGEICADAWHWQQYALEIDALACLK